MHCVGNDIVSLRTPHAMEKPCDRRYVRRVCTEAERDALAAAACPSTFFWALWACKESAYKISCKLQDPVSSAPARYPVTFNPAASNADTLTGTVTGPCGVFRVCVEVAASYLHAIAYSGDDSVETVSGIECMPPADAVACPGASAGNASSRHVRASVMGAIAARLGIPLEALAIVRPATSRGLGPPVLLIYGARTGIDLSLSHDGGYVAWSYCVPFSPEAARR